MPIELPRCVWDRLAAGAGDAAAAAIVSQRSCCVVVDVDHPAFPAREVRPQAYAAKPRGGPGTELSKILAWFGVRSSPACRCKSMAARMDALGPDGSEAILDEVLAVMRQEAKRRGLPWSEAVGLLLVKWAIRRARRAS